MKIPPRLDQLLREDQGLHAFVGATLTKFRPWIADNKLPFFPGYTDHGCEHIESVMAGAEGLICDPAWDHLTAHDAAALVLGILLHDCAMHLHEEGFLALVSPTSVWRVPEMPLNKQMNDRPWAELWGDFRREAARFDEDKLLALFGQRDPVPAPDGDPGNWTERQRLYVGEFVRRHHARLAHEIALVGVPGPGENRICFPSADDRRWFIDLVGFIARSHHLNLRAAADRMPKGSKRYFRGVHAPFVMAILRIADYIEISAPRAPSALLGVKRLRSPFSRQEWRKHAAVVHVKLAEEDPEALWVDAEPSDVKTFLGLQSLFRGIQTELDATWATLGEVYGADPKLRNLGLVVRRIRSTLDDVEAFGKQVNYLPVQASFRVSGGDVLKLLIKPLYGENPSFGVRELMQNAVDACREREDYAVQNPHKEIVLADLEADVVVHLELEHDRTGWLTIEDRGIGMTRDVVLNYFLTAGASFRNSDAWRQRHDDGSGHPRIPREGRFGVGVLAAFLIGDEIDVSTRNVDEVRGIEFSCSLEDRDVELKWTQRKVGTTVRVKISAPDIGKLLGHQNGKSWDWYGLTSPSLIRRISFTGTGKSIKRTCRLNLPGPSESRPSGWATIQVDGLDAVHWAWKPGLDSYACNGFYLTDPSANPSAARRSRPSLWAPKQNAWKSIPRPYVSVIDHQSRFPINLTRTGLTNPHASLDQKLISAVCRDVLASLLVRLPCSADEFWHQVGNEGERKVLPYDPESRAGWCSFCTNPIGARFLDGDMAGDISGDIISLTIGAQNYVHRKWLDHGPSNVWHSTIKFSDPSYQLRPKELKSQRERLESFFEIWASTINSGPFGLSDHSSSLLIIDTTKWSSALEQHQNETQAFDLNIETYDNWLLMWRGDDRRQFLDLDQLASARSDEPLNPLFIIFGDDRRPHPLFTMPSPIAQAWKEFIRHPVIPWNIGERRRVLAHAYNELSEEIERWTLAMSGQLKWTPTD
jgi:molecular chaperone HtpG